MKNPFPQRLLAFSVMTAMLTLSSLTMAEAASKEIIEAKQEILEAKQESQIWTTLLAR